MHLERSRRFNAVNGEMPCSGILSHPKNAPFQAAAAGSDLIVKRGSEVCIWKDPVVLTQ
ncbi:hypothetical protein QQ991_05785 [Weizmannia coagulans]|uniref:Uncharacterized protein n=3 Tax=Heyndrickxia TaxID=2837504 RepID=A0A0C5CEY9_HEYCO|nr:MULTISPECIES: hypothetical protein [Heyndrickxia]AEO99833.1 hypothetical protein Bcoa_0614 [Heyndrickxia coagulans 36D1]AJO24125.1 hypothetical protein SB48_HM08orf05331 [Heyndrickxia coagulans]AKN54393.1 hypothetical protein AB434_1988 [Heyndrickxia coagulans]KWZ77836.1 hypothetical protein HMPREF3213_03188 [Heyndrickxia coagulans]KYC60356.1 hypothetical protein B4100_0705 [Heyndrickxia coagulans]